MSRHSRSVFLAAAVLACLPPGLSAQAPGRAAPQGFDVPAEKGGNSVPLVKLLSPAPGEVLPNNNLARTKKTVWEFTWAPVPDAQLYQLLVIGKNARIPLVSVLTGSPTYRTDEVYDDGAIRLELPARPLSYRKDLAGYIAENNRFGWRWGVRAMVNRAWGGYGDPRTFDIAGAMLKEDSSVDIKNFLSIMSAIHVEGLASTVYSTIYDLNNVDIYFYFFHNFLEPVKINLNEELKKGKHSFVMSGLFKRKIFAQTVTEELYKNFTGLIERVQACEAKKPPAPSKP